MYKNIKSEFIKNKIKKTPWEAREYIDDLIKIEERALGKGGGGLASGYITVHLKKTYPKEWEIIYKELNPAAYKHQREREEKSNKEWEEMVQRQEKERIERLEKARKEWIEMGGN